MLIFTNIRGLISWDSKYYIFAVLPFGLSRACYICTKVIIPAVKYLRSRGIQIVIYLDDGLVAVVGNVEAVKVVSNTVQNVNAGFVVYMEKSRYEPSKKASLL
jgi:hypothetical protein